ncbi:hypothetical protein HNQ79_003640 [Streptomyces candidus]|uniref:Uncharacterized protein n=1 Tax=Streptomyces candidus TaxID=67283 RepID=A0A7X0LQK4_9ACTN|nr:hypothetical protein [Streptomyces candidus]GHH38030.1 hypothetical protein GCM10018773_15330 [Streptomyces candidus]
MLRVRSRALAVSLLPAAVAVVLLVGGASGRLTGAGWDAARWAVSGVALVVLLVALVVSAVIVRARPAVTPTVELSESSAPDLYRLVRDLAERLEVPAPSAIALTPDCDSWLEDRSHPAAGSAVVAGGPSVTGAEPLAGGAVAGESIRSGPGAPAPVLVIGSPFLWWMRVAELRAVLAPVVAGTGPAAHPDIAAARRFVRGLDAAVAVTAEPGRGVVRRIALAPLGRISRLLLVACREHITQLERGVAAAASERARAVDYGLRIVAQEQVGLAYAGWDRLLTRVALPAWRMGRWPSRLDAGVVSALTELSRRDRLANEFASRLGERPACDLLEEPGTVDGTISLLAARLFHGGPATPGPDWSPVDWQAYPEEVVDRKWRTEAARLHRVLDALDTVGAGSRHDGTGRDRTPAAGSPTLARVLDHLAAAPVPLTEAPGPDDGRPDEERTDALAAGIAAEAARDEAAAPPAVPVPVGGGREDSGAWAEGPLPVFPIQPPRTGRDLLADHVTAMVCCAAVDTAGAAPGLDWLDGPSLLVGGKRRSDLTGPVLSLVEDGDPVPLRGWLAAVGVRPEKPVRLV